MIADVRAPAWLLAWFYGLTNSYGVSIALIAVVVMLIITPLTLKSTKGMLEMQRLAPEMRRLQNQYRNDRPKLNEEMMKLYQEHKVNPMASCLPLLAQMPVFIIMFRILHGLTYKPIGGPRRSRKGCYAAVGQPAADELGFVPRYISHDSRTCTSRCSVSTEMKSFGLDLAKSPAQALADDFGTGLIYALLVVAAGVLYFVQQRMVAARAAVEPDDVAGAAEADAVPAGGVRHLPGVLPARSDRSTTWRRRSCGSPSRRTSRGASTATTRRSAVRRSAPASAARELAKETDGDDGGGGGGFFAPGTDASWRPPRAIATQKAGAGRRRRATASRRSVQAHDRTQESTDTDRQGTGRRRPKQAPTSGRPGGLVRRAAASAVS